MHKNIELQCTDLVNKLQRNQGNANSSLGASCQHLLHAMSVRVNSSVTCSVNL